MIFNAPNINQAWADILIEELVRNGVTMFFWSPGSRSTPLIMAVARNDRATAIRHFDERGSAYAAVGYGRATGRAAGWITTSGTAVANGLPAAVEAHLDGVPLVMLTADRPPELRDTGANQTTNQAHIFGGAVRYFVDVPTPTIEINPAMVLTMVDQAVHRAHVERGGVHLNCMFREPLAPESEPFDQSVFVESIGEWINQEIPFTSYVQGSNTDLESLQEIASRVSQCKRGLIIAGKTDNPADSAAISTLASHLRWPVLADIGSQLRLGGNETVVGYADQVLAAGPPTSPPDAVLHFGGRATSKALMKWLEAAPPSTYVVVENRMRRLDPTHQVTHRIQADPHSVCAALKDLIPPASDRSYREAWIEVNRKADRVIKARLDQADAISEPAIARSLSRALKEGEGLFIGSSMPIRDMDRFAFPDAEPVRVAANRGASGIDGTVASAVGFAIGLQRPTSLLVGDLALMHDLNALQLVAACPFPVVVVVINNQGGGIFSFLPISNYSEVFEPYFGTPHAVTFEGAAAMFDLPYMQPATMEAFRAQLRQVKEAARSALIEVRTERDANATLHRELTEAVREALSQE